MFTQHTDELITVKQAWSIVGGSRPISVPTYYRHVKSGRFPAPCHPSPGISRIRRSELIAAIEAVIAKRTK
jgi:predicted DNA-binding transcriptional regulator AlpA